MTRILWTRPPNDLDHFQALLPDSVRLVPCPCYQIEPIDTPAPHTSFQAYAVLSRHAVSRDLTEYKGHYFAIGPATTTALSQIGITATQPKQATSEHLAKTIIHHAPMIQSVCILCGEQGLTTLADYLTDAGMTYHYWRRYRRIAPKQLATQLQTLAGPIDYLLATCTTTLTHLITHHPNPTALKDIPVLCLSKRIEKKAKSLGFKQFITAKTPSPEALSECLIAALN